MIAYEHGKLSVNNRGNEVLVSRRRRDGTASDASSVDITGSGVTESDDQEKVEHSRVSSTNKNN